MHGQTPAGALRRHEHRLARRHGDLPPARRADPGEPSRQPAGTAAPQRLLVTGSRTWTDENAISEALQRRFEPGAVLVTGGCPRGADAIAARIWRGLGGEVEQHPAGWQAGGRAAGHQRNAQMVAAGASECLAFICDHSRGATACAAMAERAGIPVERHDAATRQSGRHAWEEGSGREKTCRTCGLVAVARVQAGERWVTTYRAAGRTFTAERVPGCGAEPPPPADPAQLRELADLADHSAGLAWKAGDLERAARLIADARALDPGRPELWDSRERKIRRTVSAARAQRAPLPGRQAEEHSGRWSRTGARSCDAPHPGQSAWAIDARAHEAGDSGRCADGHLVSDLAHTLSERLSAAGIGPDHLQVRFLARWNQGLSTRDATRNAEKEAAVNKAAGYEPDDSLFASGGHPGVSRPDLAGDEHLPCGDPEPEF